MSNGGDGPIRRGDRGFVLRLVGGALAVLAVAVLLMDVLDSSNFGGCAARGFDQVTDGPSSH